MVIQVAVVECNGVGLWNVSIDFELGLILLDIILSVYCSCWWIELGSGLCQAMTNPNLLILRRV